MSAPVYFNNIVQIEVLLHYRVIREPHQRFSAPAYRNAALWLLKQGALQPLKDRNPSEGYYETTPLGEAWIALLHRVPKPEARVCYVDSAGKVIQ